MRMFCSYKFKMILAKQTLGLKLNMMNTCIELLITFDFDSFICKKYFKQKKNYSTITLI